MFIGAQAGTLLRLRGFQFDCAYCSVLQRCVKSLHAVLEAADQLWVPEHKSWRLNERHYGGLQDLNKAKVAADIGEDTVKAWRRSFAASPPGKSSKSTYNIVEVILMLAMYVHPAAYQAAVPPRCMHTTTHSLLSLHQHQIPGSRCTPYMLSSCTTSTCTYMDVLLCSK